MYNQGLCVCVCVCVGGGLALARCDVFGAHGQVFYDDSLKFFLSLYGHKLPVMSMDISSDSTLLLSGSADKNVKVCANSVTMDVRG